MAADNFTLGILSDIHYACAAEQARGGDFETRCIPNPLRRRLTRLFRHYIWMHNPLRHNHLLDAFLARAQGLDFLVVNGDLSCDSAFVGVSDDAACQSVRECLDKLRRQFGANFRTLYGDHEVGKTGFFNKRGGMRLASWNRARQELSLDPFWQVFLGNYALIGVASSLVALPVMEGDTLQEELTTWRQLREAHLAEIRRAFEALRPEQRVLLFCHDPTALPFLWREDAVRAKLSQIDQTIVGHLHSNLVLWKSQRLAGMPRINFLGPAVQRISGALNEARHWRSFHVRLCPALAGIELLKDGGYLSAELDLEARRPARFQFHQLPRD
jgi:hypothetical protein